MWLEHLGAVPRAVTEDSAHAALRWIKKLPKEAWKPVDLRSKDCSRIKFTARFFHAASDAWATRVPPELLSLGEEAMERARTVVPGAPWEDFQIDTLVLNRYPAGKGVAKHKDPEQWVPLVLGVTLYEDAYNSPVNAMEFADERDKRHKRLVPTPHRSAYVFHGQAYTDATHARKPCSKRQKGNVYSLTFRAYARRDESEGA